MWDRFTAAAHEVVPALSADWHGYFFESAPGLGVSVTGLVVTATYQRGPRKGDLNFAKGDPATRLTIFVPNAVLDRHCPPNLRGRSRR